jgi:hypothetical protein
MKKILFFFIVSIALVSCGNKDSIMENTIELGKSYGPVKVDTSKSVTLEEMLTSFEAQKGEMEFTFMAPMVEVCSKAGCWVNIEKENGETFMVRFKDHFTIPPKTDAGTEAYFHGRAYWDTVSVDLLRHFAEDAGKSKEEIEKITEPKFEMVFEADGITLVKK